MYVGLTGTDGERQQGLLDRFLAPSGVQRVAALAAQRAVDTGRIIDGIALYDACNAPGRVLRLLCDELARQLPSADGERARVVQLAWDVYAKYVRNDYAALSPADRPLASAFEQMLRLIEFFDCVRAADWPAALKSVEEQELIPLRLDDVAAAAALFRSLDNCVRVNFGDYLLATMRTLAELSEEAHAAVQNGALNSGVAAEQIGRLREAARALVTFAGMIDFNLPGDIHARLVRYETAF